MGDARDGGTTSFDDRSVQTDRVAHAAALGVIYEVRRRDLKLATHGAGTSSRPAVTSLMMTRRL